MACVESFTARVCKEREKEPFDAERQHWLRRQALQIVSQLPDDDGEAREILRFADALIGFVREGKLA